MKVVSIVGARPQFIKLGPLSRLLRESFEEIIIHTGQHYDHEMSDLFFDQLEIPKPDINLGVGSGLQGVQTGDMLEKIESKLMSLEPGLVLTFGDTNSTLAACLASSKLQIPTLHIEAGLRSFNKTMPEEINRVVADHTSDLLFAPTKEAVRNLENEGLTEKAVLTGDIMVDSVEFVQSKIDSHNANEDPYALLTMHRPYNVDNPENLKNLFQSLKELSTSIIFPVHPRTRNILNSNNIEVPDNIELIEPQGYIEFQKLLRSCNRVITDSGGLQKEAFITGKPCITLRPETEWVETVEAGWNLLADLSDPNLADKIKSFNPEEERPDLYGKNVAEIMVTEIKKFISRL